MAFRIENNIVNDKSEVPVKTPVQQEQKPVVVPVGQVEASKTDTEKPVEGYCIEKTSKAAINNGSDDEPDTDLHTSEEIQVDDIALGQADKISEAVRGAEFAGLNSVVTGYDKLNASDMARSNPYSILDQQFKKGFHVNGIFRYQYTNYSNKFNIDLPEINKTTNTKRIDFSSTYESPKGNTKLIFLGSGAKTEKYYKYDESIQENEELIPALSDALDDSGIEQSVVSNQNQIDETVSVESKEKVSQYHLFLGGKFKLGNDILYTNFMQAKGGEFDQSRLTEINAKYFINRFNATLDGSVEFYEAGLLKTTKTNLSCYLGSKEDEKPKQEDNAPNLTTNESEKPEENAKIQEYSKKWKMNDGLIIKMGSVNGEEQREGFGYYRTYKKDDKNSYLKATMFGLASTTQRKEETSSYYGTGGLNVLYKYRMHDFSFDAEADLKDEISFCGADKGNTFTAFMDANCKYKKTNAKFEGKYIHTPFSKYFGAALRVSHQLNKNILPFVNVSYLNQNNELGQTKGVSLLAGVNVKF